MFALELLKPWTNTTVGAVGPEPSAAGMYQPAIRIPRGFASSRAAQSLVDAVKAGLALPASAVPDTERGPPPAVPPVLGDMMRVLLKIQCEAHGVAQKLIASSSDLDQIAADDKADVPALSGWRREIFGDAALELKHGRIALSIRDRKAVVVAAGS